jgi:hypothetical protein
MARHSAGGRFTSAASSTLPGASIYAAAATGGRIREIGVFNTTSTACAVSIRRLTTAGTQGAAIDELPWNTVVASAASQMTVVNTHTVGPTITAGHFAYASIGAAVGSGLIFTFGDEGIVVPLGTGNGVGILCPVGTGQVLDFWFVWDE